MRAPASRMRVIISACRGRSSTTTMRSPMRDAAAPGDGVAGRPRSDRSARAGPSGRGRRRASPCRRRGRDRTSSRAPRWPPRESAFGMPLAASVVPSSGSTAMSTSGPGAVAHLLAVVEHRRLVLLALADHDDAVHADGVEERAHAVHGGLVGGDLVAAPHEPRRGQRAALGGANDLEREVTVRDRRHRCQSILRCAPAAPIRGVPLPDIDTIRRSFTSLSRTGADGRPLVFLDGPGGAQVPDVVIDAMARLPAALEREHRRRVRDERGDDGAGRRDARRGRRFPRLQARGDHLRAQHDDDQLQPRALVLPHARAGRRDRRHGASTTTRTSAPGSLCAKDHGLVVRVADVRDGDLQVEPAALEKVVGPRTKVCAFTLASNAVGTMPDAARPGRRRAFRRRARLDGLRALRAAPPHRRQGARRRRAAVLALQVLRAASGPRLRARGPARSPGPPTACARPPRRRPATASRPAR